MGMFTSLFFVTLGLIPAHVGRLLLVISEQLMSLDKTSILFKQVSSNRVPFSRSSAGKKN